jgi:hypothetical protein
MGRQADRAAKRIAEKEEKKKNAVQPPPKGSTPNKLSRTNFAKKIGEILEGVVDADRKNIASHNVFQLLEHASNTFKGVLGSLATISPYAFNLKQRREWAVIQTDFRRMGVTMEEFAKRLANPEFLLRDALIHFLRRPEILAETLLIAGEENDPEKRAAILLSGIRASFSEEGNPLTDFVPVESLSQNGIVTVKPNDADFVLQTGGMPTFNPEQNPQLISSDLKITPAREENEAIESHNCKQCGRVILNMPGAELCVVCDMENAKKAKTA